MAAISTSPEVASVSQGVPLKSLPPLVPAAFIPWVCREAIAPQLRREGDAGAPTALWTESNGSEGCYGGWELRVPAGEPAGEDLTVEVLASGSGLGRGTDELTADAFWHNSGGAELDWEPLLQDAAEGTTGDSGPGLHGLPDLIEQSLDVRLVARLRRPPAGVEIRLRFGLRWSARGVVRWHGWRVARALPRPPRMLRLGVASGRPAQWNGPEGNAAHYVQQCRLAGEAGVDLVCLPETVLTWGTPKMSPEDLLAMAVPLSPEPGPWLDQFRDVARAYRMGICFSVYERAGDRGEVVYNTALLLGREGELIGTYRKVHLAIAEARRGVAAGHTFPVHTFDGVRVGMAICMDSAASEAPRILAQGGAEVLLMPIMNDFRATPWGHHRGAFHAERWRLIQRAHAFDNHLYVVAAKNVTTGSAIIAPWGDVLAWNDGDRDVIWAGVNVDDRPKHNLGSSVQAVLASMRRPATYSALTSTAAPAGPPSLRP